MSERRSLFRIVYDSLIEGREREAQRAIREYLKHQTPLARRQD